MRSTNELNSRILKSTLSINQTYPELWKLLDETKSETSNDKLEEITKKDLQEYLDLINEVFSTYRSAHLNSM